jgi:hypothetical protein
MQRFAVQLNRDPLALQVSLGKQARQHLGGGLRRRRPQLTQAGGANRAGRLRPAREERGAAKRVAQLLCHAPALGGLHPAAKADAGGRHNRVRR